MELNRLNQTLSHLKTSDWCDRPLVRVFSLTNGLKATFPPSVTCLIMDLKAASLSFRVRISPDLPKQNPWNRGRQRYNEASRKLNYTSDHVSSCVSYLQKHGDKRYSSDGGKHEGEEDGFSPDDLLVWFCKHLKGLVDWELVCRSVIAPSLRRSCGLVRTVMILEKMIANIGCMSPLMMAQMVPTRIYGHSERLKRRTFRNDRGGTLSSCRRRNRVTSAVNL